MIFIRIIFFTFIISATDSWGNEYKFRYKLPKTLLRAVNPNHTSDRLQVTDLQFLFIHSLAIQFQLIQSTLPPFHFLIHLLPPSTIQWQILLATIQWILLLATIQWILLLATIQWILLLAYTTIYLILLLNQNLLCFEI
uniref:Uncharacterized protein n=1 Tax=Meloidogyne incognita TaxID=6306 RepID=A0A914LQW2_MELIC